jgi:hypothetical protein
MKFNQFEHQILPHILAPLLAGLFVVAVAQHAARADTATTLGPKSYVVSTADGYGVNDCIKTGEDCARIVADAWCSAHGHANAMSFGRAGDITGATSRPTPVALRSLREDDVFITCGE